MSNDNSIETSQVTTPVESHGVLGAITNYPNKYDSNILYAIPRAIGRDKILANSRGLNNNILTLGIDWWHCFEVSWLNTHGLSQVAMARFSIPATSLNIVESKSLKLYLNSFNLTEFTDADTVKKTIKADLEKLLHCEISIEFFDCASKNTSMEIAAVKGSCIDRALDAKLADSGQSIAITNDVSAEMLTFSSESSSDCIEQTYNSHLLRSNCPVTNQPDWGSLEIFIDCPKIDETSLLEYILTYRQHNGFHEQCVEQIFADLTQKFKPKKLMVRAWYTRRGGIDINPCRVSDYDLLPTSSRLIRQ